MPEELLRVENLKNILIQNEVLHAVDGITFSIEKQNPLV